MDSLSTVRNATTSWPTRDSTSAIFVASNVPLRIFGSADSGIRPTAAQPSQARTSIRSQSSYLCWSDHTARIAGGEYRSIKKGDSQSMLGVLGNYIGHRLIKILLPDPSQPQDLVAIQAGPVQLSVWLDNRCFPHDPISEPDDPIS